MMLERVRFGESVTERDREVARNLLVEIQEAERADPGGPTNHALTQTLERVSRGVDLSSDDRVTAARWAKIHDGNAASPSSNALINMSGDGGPDAPDVGGFGPGGGLVSTVAVIAAAALGTFVVLLTWFLLVRWMQDVRAH